MSQSIQLKRSLVVLVVITWFVLSLAAHALLPPPAPDGGYPGFNTAEGENALLSLTTGVNGTAIGADALRFDTTGSGNTAIGASALRDNTVGSDNTANGHFALDHNTIGDQNTAIGVDALYSNTSGEFNVAVGAGAIRNNTSGNDNTADGADALYSNTSGYQNVASGAAALVSNLSGHDNAASGFQALLNNTTGSNNIAIGARAGVNLTTGSNNIDIGALGVAGEANTIRIGKGGIQTKAFIQGIRGATVATGVGVIVGTTGQLGTVQSSKRFKEAIKPMDKVSETILALRPVTFRYKKELDPDDIPQFGLVAEDVEKVNPDLVVRDEKGDVSSVRYEAVNAMLLNEFLKEHRRNEEQEATIARQQKQIEALTAAVQKVSAQLQLNKPAAETVSNNH